MPKFDSTTSNQELVKHCLNGDQRAWQQLVTRYARLVHSIPVRHGLTSTEVDDVGQEVFLALAQHLHQVEDPERLPAWLITTARRLSWRALQKRKREQPVDDADLSETTAETTPFLGTTMPSIAELHEGWGRQEAIHAGLNRLGARCRDLLTMIFLRPEEPSYDDISAQLGIAKGSIGPTRSRCLNQLRDILEGLGFGPEQ